MSAAVRGSDIRRGRGDRMTRISTAQANQLGLSVPKSKYHARKVVIDGITFDSRKEAQKYSELKIEKRAGIIRDFELQPEFVLQESYIRDGKKVRPIIYRADFKVIYPDGREVIIDTKGYQTKEYKLKKKILLARYPDIEFIEE